MRSEKRKLLVSVPTGGGKAILLAEYASRSEGRTLIVVPKKELREQAIEKIKMIDQTMDVGSVQSKLNEVSNKIVVASRQSLTHAKSTRIEQMAEYGSFSTIIFDEVHEAVDQVKKIIDKVSEIHSEIKVIGLTATPWNKKLNTVFDGIDYQISILDMIMDGYLCEPKALMVKSQTNISSVATTGGEFNQKELELAVDTPQRNRLVVESYKKYAQTDRISTLVFAVGIEHLHHLVEEFKSENIYCKGIDSNSSESEREDILEEFKSGKLPVLVNCGILTTGFDYPRLDCIILARPTKSKILYAQILGRGLRLHPDKEDCLVIDINDIVRKHDLMNMSSIFDVPIQHGEKLKEAVMKYEKKKQDEVKRIEEEKQRTLERERIKQEQMRIHAEQVKLFNKDMKSAFENCKYDYFKVDNLSYALTFGLDIHYVIENYNSKFVIYKVNTNKSNKQIQQMGAYDNLKDAIRNVESRVGMNSFTDKDATWKHEPVTENQRKYCSWAKTKDHAVKYFNSSAISGLIRKYKLVNNL